MTDSDSPPEQYWSLAAGNLLASLRSAPEGLSAEEADRRLAQFGPKALGVFLNQFKSPIVLILLFATGVSAVLKDWIG